MKITTNEPLLIYLASYANPKDPSYQGQNIMAVYPDRIVMRQDALARSYTLGNQLQRSLDWEDIEVALLPGADQALREALNEARGMRKLGPAGDYQDTLLSLEYNIVVQGMRTSPIAGLWGVLQRFKGEELKRETGSELTDVGYRMSPERETLEQWLHAMRLAAMDS
jgi:hypothetical protein